MRGIIIKSEGCKRVTSKIYRYNHGYNTGVNKIKPNELSIEELNQPKTFTYVASLSQFYCGF